MVRPLRRWTGGKGWALQKSRRAARESPIQHFFIKTVSFVVFFPEFHAADLFLHLLFGAIDEQAL